MSRNHPRIRPLGVTPEAAAKPVTRRETFAVGSVRALIGVFSFVAGILAYHWLVVS